MSKQRFSSARPKRSGPGYKGAWMPSFAKQHERNLNKKQYAFLPGAQSSNEQKRNLRRKVQHIIDSVDQEVATVGARVIRSCANDPDPEYSALHLFAAALDAAQETGTTWPVAMTYLMDKFDGKIAQSDDVEVTYEDADGETAEADRNPSRLRRLLRALVPRRARKSHEAVTEAIVNQPVGDGDGEHGHESGGHTAQGDTGLAATGHHEDRA